MDAVVCVAPGQLVLERRPIPSRGADEVRIRVRNVGVCGTDMHIIRGTQPYLPYPGIMGHELSGEVVEAPRDSHLKVGDPVYVMPHSSCGACSSCRKGRPNCCTQLEVLGVHRDGGMAEFLTVPRAFVFKADGVFVGRGRNDRVSRDRRARGERVVRCLISYVGHGGSYVLVSIVNAHIAFSDPEFHRRKMTLLGSRNATTADFEEVLQAMREGKVPTRALDTHRVTLSHLPETMPTWMTPSAGIIKGIVEC